MFKRRNNYDIDKMIKSNEMILEQMAKVNKEIVDELKVISDDQLVVKDRVDISLAEYESMKKELEILRARESIFNIISTNFIKCYGHSIEELKINPCSIEWIAEYSPIYDEYVYKLKFTSSR